LPKLLQKTSWVLYMTHNVFGSQDYGAAAYSQLSSNITGQFSCHLHSNYWGWALGGRLAMVLYLYIVEFDVTGIIGRAADIAAAVVFIASLQPLKRHPRQPSALIVWVRWRRSSLRSNIYYSLARGTEADKPVNQPAGGICDGQADKRLTFLFFCLAGGDMLTIV